MQLADMFEEALGFVLLVADGQRVLLMALQMEM